MKQSPLRLIKRKVEFRCIDEISEVPPGLRGIYVLYKSRRRNSNAFDVVYVGMARAGEGRALKRRLISHSKRKRGLWTHFSIYEVWDNIRDEEVEELEGLFRHIYRRDTKANRLNVARGFKRLGSVPPIEEIS